MIDWLCLTLCVRRTTHVAIDSFKLKRVFTVETPVLGMVLAKFGFCETEEI